MNWLLSIQFTVLFQLRNIAKLDTVNHTTLTGCEAKKIGSL